jgi:hypothetical protein
MQEAAIEAFTYENEKSSSGSKMHRDFRLIHHRNTSNHHFNLDKILLKFD